MSLTPSLLRDDSSTSTVTPIEAKEVNYPIVKYLEHQLLNCTDQNSRQFRHIRKDYSAVRKNERRETEREEAWNA